MNVLQTILRMFQTSAKCGIENADSMSLRIDKMQQHVTERATVDGENEWMLVVRKHGKELS